MVGGVSIAGGCVIYFFFFLKIAPLSSPGSGLDLKLHPGGSFRGSS